MIGMESLSWLFIPIFKKKTFCFPSPVVMESSGELKALNFDDYKIDRFTDFCFWYGKKGEARCNHRSCQSLYYCFRKADRLGLWYRSLWVSYEKHLPKASAAQITSLTKANVDYQLVRMPNDFKCIPLQGKTLLLYQPEGFVYFGADNTIKAHNLVVQKGENKFDFLNKKVVPALFPVDVDYLPEQAILGAINVKGEITLQSKLTMFPSCPLTCDLYKRNLNYSVNCVVYNYDLLYFDIVEFHNAVWLNRNDSENFMVMLLATMKCFPLDAGVKAKKLLNVERTEEVLRYMGRKFFFLAPPGFDCAKALKIYENTMYKLSGMRIVFGEANDIDFTQYTIAFEPQIECVLSNSVVAEKAPAPSGEEDIAVMADEGSTSSTAELSSFIPVRLAKSTNFLHAVPKNAYDCYLMLKPSANKLEALVRVMNNLHQYNLEIADIKAFNMRLETFNFLYPNCLDRIYGRDWHTYLTSGECLIVKVRNASWQLVRCSALMCRRESQIPWVKNVTHCPDNDEEHEAMKSVFASFFDTPSVVVPDSELLPPIVQINQVSESVGDECLPVAKRVKFEQ